MIIADDQQPEASHEAQVTKVANSSTDTKAAAEETAQVAKKVSVVLVEMLIYFFCFFQKAPSKKRSHIHSLAFLLVCLTSLAWHTTMQLNFQPLEGINVSDMKHDVIFVTVCPETVKVNKYNLKPWELNG